MWKPKCEVNLHRSDFPLREAETAQWKISLTSFDLNQLWNTPIKKLGQSPEFNLRQSFRFNIQLSPVLGIEPNAIVVGLEQAQGSQEDTHHGILKLMK